ncbi:hypothetical protein GGX14DRAFT_450297 [Mycena pura]|uniref:F-box domain-containing protein n=1 Tax=Mycena pura TaxID=153505 RepID=A0AAD6YC01_9AGAR|nr:hypothetical protein GGX14DRAFT_450297 [Mycena pura]
MASLLDNVPNEIWELVFLPLARPELMKIQLTQRRLRSIARPLLFRHFTFYISDGYHPLLLERLEYWSSPEVAPCVRECSLTGTRQRPQSVLLSQAFLSHLPHFTSMRRFLMTGFTYSPAFLQALQSLPDLHHLESRYCPPDPAVSADDWALLHPLNLTFIHIDHHSVGGKLMRHDIRPAPTFLPATHSLLSNTCYVAWPFPFHRLPLSRVSCHYFPRSRLLTSPTRSTNPLSRTPIK